MQLSLHNDSGVATASAAISLRTKSRVKCCITGCNNREGDLGFSFHRFPTDSAMRSKWIGAIGHPGFYPSQSTRICSRHFTRQSFVAKPDGAARHPASRRRLYPNAVPSLFNCATAGSAPKVGSSISLISESAFARGSSQQRHIVGNTDDHSRRPTAVVAENSPPPPGIGGTTRVGPTAGRPPGQEFALLGQIVRVAMDVGEAQGHLLCELGRLGRRQKRQEALLGQLLGQLTRLVDPSLEPSPPPEQASGQAAPTNVSWRICPPDED